MLSNWPPSKALTKTKQYFKIQLILVTVPDCSYQDWHTVMNQNWWADQRFFSWNFYSLLSWLAWAASWDSFEVWSLKVCSNSESVISANRSSETGWDFCLFSQALSNADVWNYFKNWLENQIGISIPVFQDCSCPISSESDSCATQWIFFTLFFLPKKTCITHNKKMIS